MAQRQGRPWYAYVFLILVMGPFAGLVFEGYPPLGLALWLSTTIAYALLRAGQIAPQWQDYVGDYIDFAIFGAFLFWIIHAAVRSGTGRPMPAAEGGGFAPLTWSPPLPEPPPPAPIDPTVVAGEDSVLHIARIDHDVFMTYRDSAGHDTSRRITVKSIDGHWTADGKPHIDMVHAYCHTRKMARSFRADRIQALADPETGEIIEDPVAWLGITAHH